MFRRCRVFSLIILLSITALPAQLSHAQLISPDKSFAITGVSVIPMDIEKTLENQTIVVTNGVITAVGDTANMVIPADAAIIDGTGKFLMPGLADLHVHILHEDELTNYVAWGVTTIMHLGGSGLSGADLLQMREEIAAGERFGPRLYTTNRVLDGDPKLNNRSLQITDPESGRQAVRDIKSGGFDFIKIYNNLDQPEFDAIVDEARAQDLAIVGHIPRKFDALASLGGGQNAIAHTEELFFAYFDGPRSTDEGMASSYKPNMAKLAPLLDVMVEHDVAAMPDLSFTFTDLIMWDDLDLLWNDDEFRFVHPSVASIWERGNINRRSNIENFVIREQWKYELMLELTRQFEAAGILQVVGTDASLPGLFPGKAAHRELTELVKAGLSNYQALAIGTRNAGEFIRRFIDAEARVGLIRPGYQADFVLLDANPLDDIRYARMISGVSVAGSYTSKEDIDDLRTRHGERYDFLRGANLLVDHVLESGKDLEELRTAVANHALDQEYLTIIETRINAAGYGFASDGDLEEANSILKMNTELFPDSANTWDSLGEVNLYLGNRKEALTHYRKALEVDPNFTNAADQIDKILSESQ